MILDLLELKGKSAKFQNSLRFSIRSLEVEDNGNWRNFKDLKGILRSEREREATLGLKCILLDTGNPANYCLIPGNYFTNFTNNFIVKKNIVTFKTEYLTNIEGKKIRNAVSFTEFKFRLFKTVIFRSKIGFRFTIDIENMNTINIGINSIRQFLNLIFRDSQFNYYYCKNLRII